MKATVLTEGFEAFAQRSLERIAKHSKGEHVEPEKIISFEDPVLMLECLTAQRVRILQVIREKRLTISALAAELGRKRLSVTRDVHVLKKYGLIRLREQVRLDHEKAQIVEHVAQTLELHSVIY